MTLTDSGCEFETVGTVSPGQLILRIVNGSSDKATFHVWRLLEGHTFDELAAFIQMHHDEMEQGNDTGPPPFATMVGRKEAMPRGTSDALQFGTNAASHGIACAVPNEKAGRMVATYTAGPLEVSEP